jgi:hypothetical protein
LCQISKKTRMKRCRTIRMIWLSNLENSWQHWACSVKYDTLTYSDYKWLTRSVNFEILNRNRKFYILQRRNRKFPGTHGNR